MRSFDLWFDGACEPCNPGGWIGVGVHIVERETGEIFELSRFRKARPENTNNTAEYLALGIGLDFVKKLVGEDLSDVEIRARGDSQLVIYQLQGKYRMNHGRGYSAVSFRVRQILSEFPRPVALSWIPREQNTEADRLSKLALTEQGISITHRERRRK